MSDGPFHNFNLHVIQNGDMSSTIASTSVNVQETLAFAVHGVWDSGAALSGTFDVQGSNDDSDFVSILDSPLTVSGVASSHLVNVEKAGYGYVRVVYTASAGSGNLNVRINGKRG